MITKTRDRLRPLLFLHIPKTSGTALIQGLRQSMPDGRVIAGFDRVLFGAFRDFETMTPDQQRAIYLGPSELPPESDLVAGHFAFSTLRQNYPSGQLVTFLKEPLSRILSHWIYWRGLPDSLLEDLGTWADIVRSARRPLKSFLSHHPAACQTDNLSLRMLLWPHPLIPDDDFIDIRNDAALLHEAIQRLRGFAYADVIENPVLEKSFGCWLGPDFRYRRSNETEPVPLALRLPLDKELTPETAELLQQRSRLDRILWQHVARHRTEDADALRERSMIRNISRYGRLLATPS